MVRAHAITRFRERVAPLPWRDVAQVLLPLAAQAPAKSRQWLVSSEYQGTQFVAVVCHGAVITVWKDG